MKKPGRKPIDKAVALKQKRNVFSGLNLTQRQILYVIERFNPDNNDNKLAAYRKAGYSYSSDPIGRAALYRLEGQSNIKEAFKRYIDWVMGAEKDKLRLRILDTLKTQAFYDTADFFTSGGKLIPLDQIPQKLRPCIAQLDTKGYGKDAIEITNYRLVDKGKALKQLIDYMNLGDSEQEVTIKAKGGSKGSGDNSLPTINIMVGRPQ